MSKTENTKSDYKCKLCGRPYWSILDNSVSIHLEAKHSEFLPVFEITNYLERI